MSFSVLRELLKPTFGRTCRVGWVVPRLRSYAKADASTRVRAYDLLGPLNEAGVQAELYRPFFDYRAVVFQKAFGRADLELAAKLKKRGARVIVDVNVNYLEADAEFAPEGRRAEAQAMLDLADAVVASSPHLAAVYAGRAPKVFMVPDPVPMRLFPEAKRHAGDKLTLLYCGYAVKAVELLPLAELLERHRLLLVCERDPRLSGLDYQWERFSHDGLAAAFAQADVKIAPRDLSRPYNLGHSTLKIALPMAAGLPAVASRVPSYAETPAVLCDTERDWAESLERLRDPQLRQRLGEAGRQWVRRELDVPVVAARYAAALKEALA